MRSVLLPCLFSALTTTLLAAPPQYTARKDTATNFQHLTGLVLADFNNDGDADIAITDNSDKQPGPLLRARRSPLPPREPLPLPRPVARVLEIGKRYGHVYSTEEPGQCKCGTPQFAVKHLLVHPSLSSLNRAYLF